MTFSIITLFPEMFDSVFKYSIIKRAQDKGVIKINLVNLRDFGHGTHKTVDDRPYGGGTGMILKIDVLYEAIQRAKTGENDEMVFLLDPKGEKFFQKNAENLAKINHLILICGHYEGVDDRIRNFIDGSLSIGDFVLSGGEIPAMAVVESVARLVPGVLTKDDATVFESFSEVDGKRILETPKYTRPEEFMGYKVPQVLLSGNEKKIQEFRKKEARSETEKNRPDLLTFLEQTEKTGDKKSS